MFSKQLYKPGDIAYVVLIHNKNHKNVEYYVDKIRVCGYNRGAYTDYYYTDHKFDEDAPLSNLLNAKRTFRPHRLFKTFEEAQKYADYKNEEKKLRDKYNFDKNNLMEDMLNETIKN